MNEKQERLAYSVPETAEQLGVSLKTCYDLVHRADFPSLRIGHRIVVSREGLREWVRKQEQSRMGAAL